MIQVIFIIQCSFYIFAKYFKFIRHVGLNVLADWCQNNSSLDKLSKQYIPESKKYMDIWL